MLYIENNLLIRTFSNVRKHLNFNDILNLMFSVLICHELDSKWLSLSDWNCLIGSFQFFIMM